MTDDYIILQLSPDGDSAEVGFKTGVGIAKELIDGLIPKEKSKEIQFCRLPIVPTDDDFTSLFLNYRQGDSRQERDANEQGGVSEVLLMDGSAEEALSAPMPDNTHAEGRQASHSTGLDSITAEEETPEDDITDMIGRVTLTDEADKQHLSGYTTIAATVVKSASEGIIVEMGSARIGVAPLPTLWKQMALADICRPGSEVLLAVRELDFTTSRIDSHIVGISQRPFLEGVPKTETLLKATVCKVFARGWLLGFDGRFGIMPAEESDVAPQGEDGFGCGEEIEVMVKGLDLETTMPLLSYKEALAREPQPQFVVGEKYEAEVISSNDKGIIVNFIAPKKRHYLPLRFVYSLKNDYDNRRISAKQRLKLTCFRQTSFITDMLEKGPSHSEREQVKLTLCSSTASGMNMWNDDDRLVWIASSEMGYRKHITAKDLRLLPGDATKGWYLNKDSLFYWATLKPNKSSAYSYPLRTVLHGRVKDYDPYTDSYIIYFDQAQGVMTSADISWEAGQHSLEIGQEVRVTVARRMPNTNVLGVTMLTPHPFGKRPPELMPARVSAINEREIEVSINGIRAVSETILARKTFGIDNFGNVKLKPGDMVKARLDKVDLKRRIIIVELRK